MSYSDWIALCVSFGSLAVSAVAFVRTGRWRTQERREAVPQFEVLARPWYTLGMAGDVVLARVEMIAQNTSNSDVAITELGIEPVGVDGPLRILRGGNSPPEMVKAKSPLYFTIPSSAFSELLDVLPGPPDEQQFSLFVRSGHGSTGKYWTSAPFSVASAPPNEGGYSEWTG